PRRRARRNPDRLHRRRSGPQRTRIGVRVPRAARIIQDSARVRPRRRPSSHRPWKGPTSSPSTLERRADVMTAQSIAIEATATRTKVNREQIVGFWAAWTGWLLAGMDSVIYALVLAPALTELLPRSGMEATPANVGFVGSVLFAAFLVGWGLSFL